MSGSDSEYRYAPLVAEAQAQVQALAAADKLRTLDAIVPRSHGRAFMGADSTRAVLNFCSNDYMGLTWHPQVQHAMQQAVAEWGAGAAASRLVCGTFPLHTALEQKLARVKGKEAALFLNSGFQANASVLPALARLAAESGYTPVFFADKLIHASMYHGCAASGARLLRFRHNDVAHLITLLGKEIAKAGDKPIYPLVLTESVFSMDGDVAPLDDLIAATRAHGGFLYVDEAHAAGVLGTAGMGLCVGKDVDMVLGTCGKGLGVSGAYVAGRRALIDWLITACAGFIYATALPPAVVAAVDVALDVVAAADAERAQVLAMAAAFRADMHALGLDTGGSTTQIVPVIIGSEKAALDVAAALKEKGFFVQAVRPPTVPPGTARLRVTITAAHTPADVAALAAAIAEIMAETQIKDTPDA